MTADTPRSDEILMAREIDTRISEAYDVFYVMRLALQAEQKTLAKYKKSLKLNYDRSAAGRLEGWIDQVEARIARLEPRVAARERTADNLNATLYGGWSRFFLVKHIHKSLYCSSFRPTTRVVWLPAVSGLTEAEAVAEYGATLCTICFPDAPTELTTARVDPDLCRLSGTYINRDKAYRNGRFYTCVCGKTVQRTTTGLARKHKK